MTSSGMSGAIRKALNSFLIISRGKLPPVSFCNCTHQTTGQKRRAEDADYEDDGFVVQPKKVHLNPIDGQIGPCAGHEYEKEEPDDSETSDEAVLSDPSDLFDSASSESEPETENDYPLTDKRHESCDFIDDEAEESGDECDADSDDKNSSADDFHDYESVSEDGTHDSGASDTDRAVRSPLQKSDFEQDEAQEHNNIFEHYNQLIGKVQLTDSDSSRQSQSDSSDDLQTADVYKSYVAADEADTSDDDSIVVMPANRRRVVLLDSEDESDSDDSSSLSLQDASAKNGSVIPLANMGSANSSNATVALVNYSLSDEEKLSSSDARENVVVNGACPPQEHGLTTARRRYLHIRTRIKPWIVTSV